MDLPPVYPATSPNQHDRRFGPVLTEAYRATLRQMYGDTFVLLRELAAELTMDYAQLRRFVKRHGLPLLHLDPPTGTRGVNRRRPHAALSLADAHTVRALREQQKTGTLPRFWYRREPSAQPAAYLHPVVVYALADPRTEEVRYIGVAVDPVQRYAEHCVPTFRGKNIHRYRWIQQLRALDLKPRLIVLDTCATGPEAVERERHYIALYRSQGARLVNKTDGGDGVPGYTHSADTRARISASQKGVPESPQTRALLSRMRHGKKKSERAREADSRAALRRWQDPAYREATSEGIRRSFAQHPERAQRLSVAMTASWKKRRQQANALQLPLPLGMDSQAAIGPQAGATALRLGGNGDS